MTLTCFSILSASASRSASAGRSRQLYSCNFAHELIAGKLPHGRVDHGLGSFDTDACNARIEKFIGRIEQIVRHEPRDVV